MHEFDKCHFCASYNLTEGWCDNIWCDRKTHTDYILDVNKILNKAKEMGASISDVIALMNEVAKNDD